LYLVYIVRIGGDFMAGRLLTPVLLCSLLLLGQAPVVRHLYLGMSVLATVIGIGLLSPHPPLLSGASYGRDRAREEVVTTDGIADERAFYYPHTGLLGAGPRGGQIDHPWANNGRQARRRGETLLTKRTIGFFGFHAGPRVHIIDLFGLADPLLARLPARPDDNWRIGHPERDPPPGYVETVRTGQNRIQPAGLARYYDQLALITRAPLFSPGRLATIIKFNLGLYNDDLASYLESRANRSSP
jgi:arabinofuranosyltransferase